MTSRRKWLLLAPAALLAAQLVPVPRTNPPVESDARASPEVKAILRRACYDCHSHETVWGPHTSVAPISWLAAYDVAKGREELNLSRWAEVRRDRLARKVRKEVLGGEMPPWLYVMAHPAARLSDAEREALAAWADAAAAGAPRGEERGRQGRDGDR